MPEGEGTGRVRSRLRWFDEAGIDEREFPHIAGRPVDGASDPTWIRVREWPNRLGVREEPRPGDEVRWYPILADRPPTGHIEVYDPAGGPADPVAPVDLVERTRWLEHLVARLAQRRGIRPAGPVLAPCAVILTSGRAARRADSAHGWPSAVRAVPGRLAEFPGGIQLVVTDSVWAHREEYADHVVAIMDGGD